MEESTGDSGALQPQDLSSCSLPSVFTDEALLKASVVPTPGWFLDPGTSEGLLLAESESNQIPLEQIQPDDAFSNTTVTLSYVSRSHVFSDHSSLYGVPSAFLRPYDPAKLASDAENTALTLDQHCLQPVSVPLGLSSCEPFGFMSPAQVMENMAALCYLQQTPSLQDVENLALETLKSLQAEFPMSVDQLQNGATNGGSSIWNVEGGFQEDAGMNEDEGLHRNLNPELVFLISRSEEPLALENGQGSEGFAVSLNQDLMSPLDHTSTSEEQREDGFAVAQTMNPESGAVDHGNQQETELEMEKGKELEKKMVMEKELEKKPRKKVKMEKNLENEKELETEMETELEKDAELETVMEKKRGKKLETEMSCDKPTGETMLENEESRQADKEAVKTRVPKASVPKGNMLQRKTLPPRSRRGMRMEAIVQNIHPLRSRSSRTCVIKASRSKELESRLQVDSMGVYLQREPTGVRRSSRRRSAPSYLICTNMDNSSISPNMDNSFISKNMDNSSISPKISNSSISSNMDNSFISKNMDNSSISPKMGNSSISKNMDNSSISPKTGNSPISPNMDNSSISPKTGNSSISKNRSNSSVSPNTVTYTDNSSTHTRRMSSKSMRNLHPHLHTPAFPNPPPKPSSSSKRLPSTKRKQKMITPSRPSFFSPQEPQIKLKCLSHGEQRKEPRDLGFAPYVQLDLRQFPICKVINSPGKRRTVYCGTGAIPTAQGLRFGRSSVDGAHIDPLICCLCGSSSNSGDLGDLLGPYCPDGLPPAPAPEEDSDSDSRLSGDGGSSIDGFGAPLVPLGQGERWLHEDCAVWSAGVFLVRGKLYGLEKAVRMASTSVCSSCQRKGATLGCVCKGCPSRFHYTCARQSGCVLNEDNFSMKCRKHKSRCMSGSLQRQSSR